MTSPSSQSQRAVAGWTGAHDLLEKWLDRRRTREGIVELVGGTVFLAAGIAALIFTSCVTAFLVLLILLEIQAAFSLVGIRLAMLRPLLFGLLFLLFLGISILHAYRTRWGTESAAKVDLRSAATSIRSLVAEFFAAGPSLLIMAGQDLFAFSRLSRMDVPQVTGVLLWLFDRGGRAGFAEIALAFPGLNIVRVLPQFRDLPGVTWWPDEGVIALSDDWTTEIESVLGRKPKTPRYSGRSSEERTSFRAKAAQISEEAFAWYAALGLPSFATLQQVKSRYRKLAKIYHPDARAGRRNAGDARDDEQMKRINEAYHGILKHSQEHAGAAG